MIKSSQFLKKILYILQLIENNEADMVSFGSAYIANPDLVNRIENNYEWARPDNNSFYTADAIGFTDYPIAI